jgi:two-component system, OmpR family, alkaline phosphatase synthesis response regulator PhoP
MDNILLVEDEYALRMTLGDRLRKEGYLVDYGVDGEEGFAKATQLPFDLIILDIMLPRRDGLEVCSGIRESGVITPILMLTARGRTPDKVAGLKIGADDYVTKPFKMPELLARVEALLRRAPTRPAPPSAVYEFGNMRVDIRGTEVTRNGKVVGVSAREFQLLRFFLENQGTTLSREDLLTRVWGYSTATFTRTVDVHVASLRQKLEDDPRQPRFFVTVQGLGYKFKP